MFCVISLFGVKFHAFGWCGYHTQIGLLGAFETTSGRSSKQEKFLGLLSDAPCLLLVSLSVMKEERIAKEKGFAGGGQSLFICE